MDKLKNYINGFSKDEQNAFADLCGTSIGYLRRAISGGVKFSPELCCLIETNSHHAVTRKDLRPNDWHEIWPELAKAGEAA